MNSQIILQNISKHISLTPDEEEYFTSLLIEKTYKSEQLITKEGSISKYITFINKGCCRTFILDKNGFEHILSFASKDYWVGDLYSRTQQKSGILYVQAMEETEVLQMSLSNLNALYLKIPKFERMFRILSENAYIQTQNRVMEFLSLSAEERYYRFLDRFDAIKDQLPQKQIALYLGVTPEFFSRMKKKLK